MAVLTVQKATADAPLQLVYGTASAAGDSFINSGRERLRIKNTTAAAIAVAPPTVAPTLVAAAGTTNLPGGTYLVAFAWGNASGETALGPTATVTITFGQQINVSAIPALPGTITFAAVYVSMVNHTVPLRSGQTATTTYTITAPAAGALPQNSMIVRALGQRSCNQKFKHDAAQLVPPAGELLLGPFDPARFNDTGQSVQLRYSTVTAVQVAVEG